MNRPLLVYLDAKDYSMMADRRNSSPNSEYSKTLDFLSELVRRNSINVVYSYMNIAESVPRSTDYALMSDQRFRLIERLSQGKCLRYPSEIAVSEVNSVWKGEDGFKSPRDSSYAFSSENNWLSVDGLDLFISESFLANELKKNIDRINASRQQKRRMVRKLISDNQKLSRTATLLLRDSWQMSRMLSQPGSDEERFFSDIHYSINDKAEFDFDRFRSFLMKFLLRPSVFGRIVGREKDYNSPLNEVMRVSGSSIAQAVSAGRELMNSVIALYDFVPEKDVKAAAERGFKFRSAREKFIVALVPKETPNREKKISTANTSRLGTLPLIDSISLTLHSLSVAKVVHGFERSKESPSDFSDIMHCAYLPYVDVFSCDSRTAQFCQRAAKMYGVSVVPKFDRIRETIEQLLTAKNGATHHITD